MNASQCRILDGNNAETEFVFNKFKNLLKTFPRKMLLDNDALLRFSEILTDKLQLDERLSTYTKVPELPFGKQCNMILTNTKSGAILGFLSLPRSFRP